MLPRRPYFTLLITAVVLIVTSILVIVAISDDDKPSDDPTIYHTPLKHVWNVKDDNNSTFRWSRIDRRAEIEMEISSKTAGYVGVVFYRGRDGEPGAIRDIILAGYDDDKQNGYIEVKDLFILRVKSPKMINQLVWFITRIGMMM